MKQIEKSGTLKSTHVNNYIKCKWTDKLDKKAGLNYVLAAGDTLIFIDIKTFRLKG